MCRLDFWFVCQNNCRCIWCYLYISFWFRLHPFKYYLYSITLNTQRSNTRIHVLVYTLQPTYTHTHTHTHCEHATTRYNSYTYFCYLCSEFFSAALAALIQSINQSINRIPFQNKTKQNQQKNTTNQSNSRPLIKCRSQCPLSLLALCICNFWLKQKSKQFLFVSSPY